MFIGKACQVMTPSWIACLTMAISVAFGQITQCEWKFGEGWPSAETEPSMSWGYGIRGGGAGEEVGGGWTVRLFGAM
jgi:hypothetical protein